MYSIALSTDELISELKKTFGEELYEKPTDVIGFTEFGKNIALALESVISKKEICFYDDSIKSDPDFHFLELEKMLEKSEIMVVTEGKYLPHILEAVGKKTKVYLLQNEEPNETTRRAIEDAINDRNMVGPFYSVEELMEDLNSDD